MKTIAFILFCFLLHVPVFACIISGPSQKFIITNRHTGKPLYQASITFFDDHTISRQFKTDSQGVGYIHYYGGKVQVVVKYPGMIGFDEDMELSDEKNTVIELELSPRKYPKINITEKERAHYWIFSPPFLSSLLSEKNKPQADLTGSDMVNFSCHFKHQTREAAEANNSDKLFNELLVYPNPVSPGSSVYIESKFDGKKTILIYDMLGNEVEHAEMEYHYQLQGLLKPGLYVIKMIDARNDDVTVQKLKVE